MSDPNAMLLRATRLAIADDADGAIALLLRAIAQTEGESTPYLVEFAVPLLIDAGRIDEARALHASLQHLASSELIAFSLTQQAHFAAIAHRRDESRALDAHAIRLARAGDDEILGARVYYRLAIAAVERDDLDEAQDRALDCARAFERAGAHGNAGRAYEILATVAHQRIADPDIARFYADRIALAGRRADDPMLEQRGITLQLVIAAESGDVRRYASLRSRVASGGLDGRSADRLHLAEALFLGWSGDFAASRPLLAALRTSRSASARLRDLALALTALTHVAAGENERARQLSRQALTVSAEGAKAAIIAVATGIIAGDAGRARRGLAKLGETNAGIARALSARGIGEHLVPVLFRGYARFINAAVPAAKTTDVRLTPAERRILALLHTGGTVGEIAASLGRSPKTVERHIGAIYQKLHVTNRTQAVLRARNLGLDRPGPAHPKPPSSQGSRRNRANSTP